MEHSTHCHIIHHHLTLVGTKFSPWHISIPRPVVTSAWRWCSGDKYFVLNTRTLPATFDTNHVWDVQFNTATINVTTISGTTQLDTTHWNHIQSPNPQNHNITHIYISPNTHIHNTTLTYNNVIVYTNQVTQHLHNHHDTTSYHLISTVSHTNSHSQHSHLKSSTPNLHL